MIDYGLVVSLIVAFGFPTLLAGRWPLTTYTEPTTFVDAVLPLAFAGLVVGRLTTLALDDPSSIGSISDMLIIRKRSRVLARRRGRSSAHRVAGTPRWGPCQHSARGSRAALDHRIRQL